MSDTFYIRTTAEREEAVLRNKLDREQFTDDIRNNIHRFTTKPEEDEKRATRLAKSGEVFAEYERLSNADLELINAERDRLAVRDIAGRIAERVCIAGVERQEAAYIVPLSLAIARQIVEATRAVSVPTLTPAEQAVEAGRRG